MEAQLCTFRVDEMVLGVDVLEVREVLRTRVVTPVPLAADGIAGLLNLRGEIVTAVDLRAGLGRPRSAEPAPAHVVVRTDEGPVALGVDEVGEVLSVDPADLQPPPATVDPTVRQLLLGTHLIGGAPLLVLDPRRVLASSTGAAR
jgi:purine-binding chemotaxis protein CheW